MDEGAQQHLAASRIVFGANTIEDRLIVDVGQLHPDHRVGGVGDADLGDFALRPVPDHREGLPSLAIAIRADGSVVEGGQAGGRDVFERRHVRGDRRQQQRLGDALLAAEA